MERPTLDFLVEALELKDESRTGWDIRNVENPETVAGHSWGVALLTLAYADSAGVDEAKALELAVVHDVVEARTGDMAVGEVHGEVTDDERSRIEREAMAALARETEVDGIRGLWREFEDGETSEATFVSDMDFLDMCLQALKYETDDRYDADAFDGDDLDGFFETADRNLETETGRELFEEVRERYEVAKACE